MSVDRAYLAAARAALTASGDPERALDQQRYMKSAMPYAGVAMPGVNELARGLASDFVLADRASFEATVRAQYDEAEFREERYLALMLVGHRRYRAFRDADSLPLWRHLIVTGAWWDLVDGVAADRVGEALRAEPDAVGAAMWAWASEDDLWLRRSAIICQIKSRDATDVELLTHAIDANVEGTPFGREFFIRKAIGWALRSYAYTAPDWVAAFLAERAGVLSGLSRREASKHLPRLLTGS